MLKVPIQAPMPQPSPRRLTEPVLVAIGATGGMAAIDAARSIASRESRDLVVVSVVEPPAIYTFETNRALILPWIVEQQTAERRERVHAMVHRLGVQGAQGEPTIAIAFGEPGVEINRLAREFDAHLVVMGIGPHAARRHELSPGMVAAVSEHSPCPVLAVAEYARVPARVAVIATDFSPESLHAARLARELVAPDATVDVVHACRWLDTEYPSAAVAALNGRVRESLPAQFDRVRRVIDETGSITVHPVALEGQADDIVLGVARAKRADLIVVASHGHGALRRWLLGSTSSALLRRADCSVLLVPAPSPGSTSATPR